MRVAVEAVKRDGKAFKGVDGEWYGARTAVCGDLTAGDTVVFENQKRGKWNNIVDDRIEIVTGETPAPAAAGGSPAPTSRRWHAYEDKPYQDNIQKRIGRQNALTNAVQAAGPIPEGAQLDRYVGVVLSLAESFARWTGGQATNDVLALREPQNEAPTPPPAEQAPVPAQEYAPTVGPADAPVEF